MTISTLRGEPVQLDDGPWLCVTIHPSYLLRLRTGNDVKVAREKFGAEPGAIQ